MKAIQQELGDGEDGKNEVAELEEKVAATKLSKEALEKVEAEIKKLKNTMNLKIINLKSKI